MEEWRIFLENTDFYDELYWLSEKQIELKIQGLTTKRSVEFLEFLSSKKILSIEDYKVELIGKIIKWVLFSLLRENNDFKQKVIKLYYPEYDNTKHWIGLGADGLSLEEWKSEIFNLKFDEIDIQILRRIYDSIDTWKNLKLEEIKESTKWLLQKFFLNIDDFKRGILILKKNDGKSPEEMIDFSIQGVLLRQDKILEDIKAKYPQTKT